MKKILLTISLSCISFASANLEETILQTLKEEMIVSNGTKDCDFAIQQITQFSIPAVITTPGLYCVAPNITFNNDLVGRVTVGRTQSTGITINSNNVILDFNDTILEGTGGFFGIQINGRSNIIIRNGTIRSMANSGIFITNTQNQLAGQILIENMTFLNNNAAINIFSNDNIFINKCDSFFSAANGFFLSQVTNAVFKSCLSISNRNSGFNFTNCDDIQCNDCIATDNTLNGFTMASIINSQFRQCTANENAIGFLLFNNSNGAPSNNNTYNNCVALQNNNNGFQINSLNTNLLQCQASNNLNGFLINNNANTLIELIAKNNTNFGIQIAANDSSIQDSHALNNNTGFFVNGNGHTLLNCIAKQNSNGFFLASTNAFGAISSNCQVRNNTATDNAAGFINTGTNNRFYSNFANNNITNNALNNYVGVPNVATSPSILTPINFTANIQE